MSRIFGILSFPPRPLKEELYGMEAALIEFPCDASDRWNDGEAGLGCRHFHTTSEACFEHFPMVDRATGLVLAADARIDNREVLISLLGVPHSAARPATDGELILESYKKWGEEAPAHLLGDFAFVIWNPKEKILFCARDHVGTRPLYYYEGERVFLLASEISAILAHPSYRGGVEESFFADFLCKLSDDKEHTVWKGIYRLPPAHSLQTGRGRAPRIRCYWRLDPATETRFAREEEYFDAFREKLSLAIKYRLRRVGSAACELSGGLDSSSVAAMAQGLLRKEGDALYTFTNARPQEDSPILADTWRDERPFVDPILLHAGLDRHTYVTAPKEEGFLHEALLKQLRSCGGPKVSMVGVISSLTSREASRCGARILLSGLGGDQLVSSLGIGYYAELLQNRKWRKMIGEARGLARNKGGSALKRLLLDVILQAYPSLGRRISSFRQGRWPYYGFDPAKSPIAEPFAKRSGMELRFKTSMERYSIYYQDMHGSLRQKQADDAAWGYLPDSMEDRASNALLYGVEARYPLLDRELMEFVLSLPSDVKMRNGWDRWLIRKAMEGMITPQIQWRWGKVGAVTAPYFIDLIRGSERRFLETAHALREIHDADNYLDLVKIVASAERMPLGEEAIRQGAPVFWRGIIAGLFLAKVEDIAARG